SNLPVAAPQFAHSLSLAPRGVEIVGTGAVALDARAANLEIDVVEAVCAVVVGDFLSRDVRGEVVAIHDPLVAARREHCSAQRAGALCFRKAAQQLVIRARLPLRQHELTAIDSAYGTEAIFRLTSRRAFVKAALR